MKPTVVLYPVSGMGHVVPVVELAKLFLLHDFAVTVVLMHSPIYHPSLDPSLARLSAAYPSMSFHSLPLPLPPSPQPAAPTSSHYWRTSDLKTGSYSTSSSPTAALPMSAPSSSTSSASPPSSTSRLTSSYPPAPAVLPSFYTLPTIESTTELSLCQLGPRRSTSRDCHPSPCPICPIIWWTVPEKPIKGWLYCSSVCLTLTRSLSTRSNP